jgi:uncharacterized membrane-anchored protein
MNAALTRTLIVLGAVLVLALVNMSIQGKERIVRTGETIYLELRPVDPRSLMQGDYMALRFSLADRIGATLSDTPMGASQAAQIVLDERRVATLAPPGTKGDLFIRYRLRGAQVWLGTNAYFFEEGTARNYNAARYAEFKVDRSSGEAVLVGLRDVGLGRLEP